MNRQKGWMILLALAGVLALSLPALAQGRGGGPGGQAARSDQAGPGRGYRNCPNYVRLQNCRYGNPTPQGPRGPRWGGRYLPNPPAAPQP